MAKTNEITLSPEYESALRAAIRNDLRSNDSTGVPAKFAEEGIILAVKNGLIRADLGENGRIIFTKL